MDNETRQEEGGRDKWGLHGGSAAVEAGDMRWPVRGWMWGESNHGEGAMQHYSASAIVRPTARATTDDEEPPTPLGPSTPVLESTPAQSWVWAEERRGHSGEPAAAFTLRSEAGKKCLCWIMSEMKCNTLHSDINVIWKLLDKWSFL